MKIINTQVYGLDDSIIASSYPMLKSRPTEYELQNMWEDVIMERGDSKRQQKAYQLGSTPIGEGHDQFLTGIIVQFDVDFTIKAWVEAQRYHFLDFVSSMSTMHRLTSFELDEAYVDYVDPRMIDIMNELKDKYNENKTTENKLKLIYSNPVGMKLTARMTTNYRQLKTIFSQRNGHLLPEWHTFCEWIENLPYFVELTGIERKFTKGE